jgi:hypothetical protein
MKGGDSFMDVIRRDFLKLAGVRLGGFALPASASDAPKGAAAEKDASGGGMFDVRKFGAMADGKTIDSPAIDKM